MQLEKVVQRISRIERAREKQCSLALSSRHAAFCSLTEMGATEVESAATEGSSLSNVKQKWMIAACDGAIAEQLQKHIEGIAKKAASQLQASQDEMFLRRKERLQVETVLRDAEQLLKKELERRQQRILDDWFAASHHKGRRSRI